MASPIRVEIGPDGLRDRITIMEVKARELKAPKSAERAQGYLADMSAVWGSVVGDERSTNELGRDSTASIRHCGMRKMRSEAWIRIAISQNGSLMLHTRSTASTVNEAP